MWWNECVLLCSCSQLSSQQFTMNVLYYLKCSMQYIFLLDVRVFVIICFSGSSQLTTKHLNNYRAAEQHFKFYAVHANQF